MTLNIDSSNIIKLLDDKLKLYPPNISELAKKAILLSSKLSPTDSVEVLKGVIKEIVKNEGEQV